MKIGRQYITACLLAALALPAAAIRQVEASPVDGTWIIRDVIRHIFDCETLSAAGLRGSTIPPGALLNAAGQSFGG
jgi:hypothetical protein